MRLPLLALGVLLIGLGIGDLERGNRHYRAGRYEEAVEAYHAALERGKDSPQLRYNLGTALLQLGRFDEAREQLQAALASVDPDVRPRATFNLGTTLLRAGRAAQEPGQRDQLLDGAVQAFKNALRVNPADVDAKWNLELALREKDNPPPSGGDAHDDGSGGDQQPDASEPPTDGPQQRPGQRQDDPSEAADQAPLTPGEAERILNAVEQNEREVYRQQLRQDRSNVRVLRDW